MIYWWIQLRLIYARLINLIATLLEFIDSLVPGRITQTPMGWKSVPTPIIGDLAWLLRRHAQRVNPCYNY